MIKILKRKLSLYLKSKEKIERRKYWKKEFEKNIQNKNLLNKKQKQQIRKFYNPYIKVDTLFHNFYLEKTGKFHVDFIPDDIYYSYIDTYYNDWSQAKYVDNKCYYDKLFNDVKKAENIVYRINNVWLDNKYNIISYEDVNKMIENQNCVVIKKATDSEGGHGVFFIESQDYLKLDNIISQIDTDIVIQKQLKQHNSLNKLNDSSINTIRLISLLTKNKVKIYSGILRMGINGSRVDNASSGGITCGITEDGNLKRLAYTASGISMNKHPNSKVKFENYKIVNYDNIKKIVSRLHTQIPHFRLVSWDFALDESGEPVLIEANLRYGELDFHQLNNGPIFKEDTKKILDEVFKK